MQLESHATPSMETPQQRYANLHRAIERGLDSDEVWKELADVSLRLGHGDEAVRCMRRVRSETVRLALESRLARLGLVAAPSQPAEASPATAPAASDAGSVADAPTPPGGEIRLADHVADAFQYLLHQHMPALVLLTTLAFPLVVGVGGFLTAGGSLLLLAAIAALPGLCVLAIVGAMGRQVLLASAEGNGDVPPIPGFGDLVRDARTFLTDAALVLGTLLGPSLLAVACGAPWTAAVPGLLIGAFFAPAAWALRQVRGDLASLSPVTLMRAVARTLRSYPGLAVVNMLLFAPTALVAWIVFGRPVWVQIAVIGPLCVLPVFVSSRLLGTWIEVQRKRLGGLLSARVVAAAPAAVERPAAKAPGAATGVATKVTATKPAPKPAMPRLGARPAAATPAAAQAPRLPRRPEQLQHFAAPVAKRAAEPAPAAPVAPVARAKAAPAAAARAASAPGKATATKSPSPAAATAKAAPAKRSAAPAAAAPAAPAPAAKPAPRAIEGRGPVRKLTDQPDLSSMPGAVVVSGRERERQGAAAKKS